MQITNKELFYTAMMLKLDHLVNVEYLFPADSAAMSRELEEAKQTLRKKKLLKENSKGEVAIDLALTACASLCAHPQTWTVTESDGYYATIYGTENAYMLLERGTEGELTAIWFKDRENLDGYLTGRMNEIKTEAGSNGE